MTRLLEISFRDETTFRRFVEEQVRRGRVVAPTEARFELYASVTLRVTAGERSLDVSATVVNPVIPTVDGAAVGLEVELTRAEWTGLEWLLNVLMRERIASATREPDPGDSLEPDPDGSRAGRLDDTLAREVLADSRWGSRDDDIGHLDTVSMSIDDTSVPGSLIASLDAAPDDSMSGGVRGNAWLDDSRYGFDRADEAASSSSDGLSSSDTFESRGPIANPLRANTDVSGRYRTTHPDRAEAAEAHFQAARLALRRGDIEAARSSASLAIANNPTESEYADLLGMIERQLMDRSLPGTSGGPDRG